MITKLNTIPSTPGFYLRIKDRLHTSYHLTDEYQWRLWNGETWVTCRNAMPADNWYRYESKGQRLFDEALRELKFLMIQTHVHAETAVVNKKAKKDIDESVNRLQSYLVKARAELFNE